MTERAIFEAAIEITDTGKREAFLNEACAEDTTLRARLDVLLAAHAKASQFLSTPAVDYSPGSGDDINSQTSVMPKSDIPQSNEAGVGEAEANADQDLSFLQPSTKPGSIGQLGHYEIIQVLGHGAFGLVFKAFDEKLHRMVAIKVMNPTLAATSPPRKRFLREARSSAAVRHENIVAIHAVEEQPIPYLVMEYIPGKTLQQWLDENGPLDPVDVLKFGQQIAAGLAAAHAEGLIHRDIKPANILIDTSIDPRIKITDFGLARAVDDASMTQSGLIAGTPMYMAPEQARGQTLDHRADLFSLGSVLYTMASGRPPFRASNTIAVLKRVCEDAARPVFEVIPGSPIWLDEIIGKLHAKEPDDRFQTSKEVADLLSRCLSELQLNGRVTCLAAPESFRDADAVRRGAPDIVKTLDSRSHGRHDSDAVAAPPSGESRSMGVSGSGDPRQTNDADLPRGPSSLAEMKFATYYKQFAEMTPEEMKRALRRSHVKVIFGTVALLFAICSPFLAKSLSPLINRWIWPPIPTLAASESIAGLRFDGKDDYVKVGPVNLSSPQYTLEAFVTSAKDGDNGVIALLKNVAKEPELMYLYDGYPANQRQSGAGIMGQRPYQSVHAPLVSSSRQHRALVFDGSAMHYYVNGIWQGKRYCAARKGMMWEMRELYIGCKANETEFFRGQIDQLRLSKIARYTNNFSVESTLKSDDSTLVLYNFGEGQGDVANDASGNGHHGKINGAKWVR